MADGGEDMRKAWRWRRKDERGRVCLRFARGLWRGVELEWGGGSLRFAWTLRRVAELGQAKCAESNLRVHTQRIDPPVQMVRVRRRNFVGGVFEAAVEGGRVGPNRLARRGGAVAAAVRDPDRGDRGDREAFVEKARTKVYNAGSAVNRASRCEGGSAGL